MQNLNFSQVIRSPIRISDKTKTLIDHVFTNCPNNIVESKVPHLSLSDHFPVAITRKFTSNFKKERHQYIQSFDESLCLHELMAQPWFLVYMCEDTNELSKRNSNYSLTH